MREDRPGITRTDRERAIETIAWVVRPNVDPDVPDADPDQIASDVLDDLTSAGFRLVEGWLPGEHDEAPAAPPAEGEAASLAVNEALGWADRIRLAADDSNTSSGRIPSEEALFRLADEVRRLRAAPVALGVVNGEQHAIDAVIEQVRAELVAATSKFGSFASAHEGYAVILEELDELWDEVKADKAPGARDRMRHEALQVAAMGARFLVDLPAEEDAPSVALGRPGADR